MPDLRQTRKKIKATLAILGVLDVAAIVVLFSPLVGSTESRRLELNQLWAELQAKTKQVEPLKNLDKKVVLANDQIGAFYKKRFPSQDSMIATEFGKLAAANGVTIDQARYRSLDEEVGHLHPVELDAGLSGSYISLAKFINALERDDMFFLIDEISLVGEQNGPIKLQLKLQTYLRSAS